MAIPIYLEEHIIGANIRNLFGLGQLESVRSSFLWVVWGLIGVQLLLLH